MSDWKPIGTCPKDGRSFLVTDGYEVHEAKWLRPEEMLEATAGDYERSGIYTDGGWSAEAVTELCVLTLWREMPEPPKRP